MFSNSTDEAEMVAGDDAVQYLGRCVWVVGQKPAYSQLTVDGLGGTKDSIAVFVFFVPRFLVSLNFSCFSFSVAPFVELCSCDSV